MSEIQLFRTSGTAVVELEGHSAALEKSLQTLIEENLEIILGVRFLASEFTTGKLHGGRIDTLGVDENYSPVIIEYKRATNETVINQGLYYLDWLLDHRGDFELLVQKKFGAAVSSEIAWSAPRLICIAGDFSKYDEHAVRQINRNIDLVRYKHFGVDLLLIELAYSTTATSSTSADTGANKSTTAEALGDQGKGIEASLANTTRQYRDLFEAVQAHLMALGSDVTMQKQKFYYAFRRIKNFACLEVYKSKVLLNVKVDPTTVTIEEGFTRDMRETGHYGTGDLQITLMSNIDFEKAKPLLERAYSGT